ncbi:MAG: Diaminopimelate decarboxylase [Candidatus Parcubacteria bacterium]|jgi:diaminopimelate decarboxylase
MKLIQNKLLDLARLHAGEFLSGEVLYSPADLSHVVKMFAKRKDEFLSLADKNKTPFYVFDRQALSDSLTRFSDAFKQYIPDVRCYYAVKTNHYEPLLKEAIDHGYGLDVSSKREMQLAHEAGCTNIVYTGPGKTEDDIEYMLRTFGDTALLNIDSFGELQRAIAVSKRLKKRIKTGVRIFTKEHGAWSKFGIPLSELKRFWTEAEAADSIHMCAIQFHLSWNANADKYISVIHDLGSYLKKEFTNEQRKNVSIIDFGGGFRPYKSEGFYPENTPQGSALKTILEDAGHDMEFAKKHLLTEAITVEEYARQIGNAIDTYLRTVVTAQYITEPGRIISNGAMHILLRVVDKKTDDAVILDGGINILGWERFEYDYVPILNLTRPSLEERECELYGPLCMPQDSWGRYYYGAGIEEGDILLVPYQGTLTYSLAQNFIKPIPEVVLLP